MMLSQALQYPFRGKGSFRFLLILTMMQLLPLVGQLILLGYGLDVVRAISAGHTDLPPLRWLPALGDGLRILIAGFVYLLPILVTIAIVGVSSIRSGSSGGNLGTIGILLSVGVPLLLFLLRMVSARRTSPSSIRQTLRTWKQPSDFPHRTVADSDNHCGDFPPEHACFSFWH